MLGKYLPNSLAVHAVMLNTQQDSAQIHLQHHRKVKLLLLVPVLLAEHLSLHTSKKSSQDSCFLIFLKFSSSDLVRGTGDDLLS